MARPAVANPHQAKRRAPRVRPAKGHPIEIQIIGGEFLDIFHARNISEGGVKVMVPHLFEGCDVDHEVDLIVTLPGGRPFSTRGRIRHRQDAGDVRAFGVQLIRLSNADRASVAAYVQKRLAEGGET
ncbi:MAG: PilZ domain-containing protein [Deltaproteobacteria bacterium]|nr:PilZ domain-containing protein [Deltaproteobacteria bacterium]